MASRRALGRVRRGLPVQRPLPGFGCPGKPVGEGVEVVITIELDKLPGDLYTHIYRERGASVDFVD